MSKKLFGYLLAGILALALVPGTAWGVCVVTIVSSVSPDPLPSTGTAQITLNTTVPVPPAKLNQEGQTERLSDVVVSDTGAGLNCFAVNNIFRLTYNATLTNPTSINAATNANFDVYDSAVPIGSGLVILASSTVGLAPGGTPQTVITVTVQQQGTVGDIVGTAAGSAFRLKNLRVDATPLTAGANVSVTVSAIAPATTLTTVTTPVGTALKTLDLTKTGVGGTGVCGIAIANGSVLGCGNQSSGGTLTSALPAIFTLAEGATFPNGFREPGTACTTGAGCVSGVSQDIATNATSLVLDAGTSIPSGVTVTFPATISTSANGSLAAGVIFTSRSGAVTCVGPAACSAIYDTTKNNTTAVFNLAVGSAAAAAGVPTTAVNPAVGVLIAASSGAGTATLHGSFGPGSAAGTGVDDVNAAAIPRYVAANTSASATTRNAFSGNWFTINPVNTILMYSYVTTASGFITGIQVANTGNDTGVGFSIGGAAAAGNGGAQTGGIKFYFFGEDPSAATTTPVTFAVNTDVSAPGGLGPTACRGLDTNGRLVPGTAAACAIVGGTTTSGLLAMARAAGLTTATNFEGYIIAVTAFTYGHGNGVVFQGANAFAYAANVMSSTTRSITAPTGFGETLNH